jgi:hypothetical protein
MSEVVTAAPLTLERLLEMIRDVDLWLDSDVSPVYKEQPLAQDWARICKETEEKGESIAELILATGQNPRGIQEHRHAGPRASGDP